MLSIGRQKSLRDPLVGECAAELKFTASQIHVVMWLGVDGPLTMGDLARRVCITEKTITGVIDRLERDGYLQRVRDQSDRRVIRVILTKKGETEFHRLNEHVTEQIERFLSLLDKGDREALFRILEKLRDRVAHAGSSAHTSEKETRP